jgi:L-amino acid N-acyltransferase YncA
MNVRGEKLSIKRIARFIKRSVYEQRTMLIYEMDIDKAQAKFQSSMDITVQQIAQSDLKTLMHGKRDSHLEVMKNRLENGELCFVAKKDGEMMGYIWVRKKVLYFSEVYYKMQIDDDGIWVYDELTFMMWRGKGIQQKILWEIFKYHENLGYKKVYVGILSENEPSLRAHAKFGFNRLKKEIKLVKVMGVKRHKVNDLGN